MVALQHAAAARRHFPPVWPRPQCVRAFGPFVATLIRYAPRSSQPSHAHAEARVSLMLGGSVRETSDGRTHATGAGCVSLKPAECAHANDFGEDGMLSLCVYPRPGIESEAAAEWNRAVAAYRWIDGGPMVRAMNRLARRFARATARDSAADEPVYELLNLLGSYAQQETGRTQPAWLRRTRARLCDETPRLHTVADLARDAGVHPVSLTRAFRRHYGCSINEFVDRLRVERAAAALRQSQAALTQIAIDCGYADQAHFCRRFRRHFGVTPGAYRRQ